MGSEVAASSAQLRRAAEDGGRGTVLGGGSRTGAVEGTSGSGGLSSSLFCVCVPLLTMITRVGGGGLVWVGVGSLTVVSVSLVDVLESTKDGGSVWVPDSSQIGGCSPCNP